MTDQKEKESILLRLNNGETTIDELKSLVSIAQKAYKDGGKTISDLIELQSYNELQRRLLSSIFSASGKTYSKDHIKFCITAEYQNTKLFIESINEIIKIASKVGDITNPDFYGQPDPGYKISLETLVHILIRHNETMNSFVSNVSRNNGHNPSSFSVTVLADPMLTLLMALNVLEESDWKHAQIGKNLICDFRVGKREYTVIRKGSSKEIKSFYPRNDIKNSAPFIEFERNPDKMEFLRKAQAK
jgi:hypothetical protein